MIDPIKIAQQKVKLNELSKPIAGATSAITPANAKQALGNLSIPSKIPKSLEDVGLKKPELPIQPDPELLKKEAIAIAQTIRSDAEAMLQQKKEEELGKIRDGVETASNLAAKAVGLYIKMPLIDPKFLAFMAYMKAKEKLRELKQKASKENLKKSKEAFTFPMKPPKRLDLAQLSKISELPKIPKIPNIELPELPKIPNINLPKLP